MDPSNLMDSTQHEVNEDSNQDPASEDQGTPAQNEFFQLLHKMISNETHTGFIEWLPDNKGFAIPFKQSFSCHVLPRYFGKAKYTSFTRRLKRWGFTRVSKGLDVGAYYHESFHRDMVFEGYEDNNPNGVQCQMDAETFDQYASLPSSASDVPYAALPLKKRSKQRWSPEPIPRYELQHFPSASNLSEPRNCSTHNSLRNHVELSPMTDVHQMPEIMRMINQQKRKERKEGIETPPAAKKPKLHNALSYYDSNLGLSRLMFKPPQDFCSIVGGTTMVGYQESSMYRAWYSPSDLGALSIHQGFMRDSSRQEQLVEQHSRFSTENQMEAPPAKSGSQLSRNFIKCASTGSSCIPRNNQFAHLERENNNGHAAQSSKTNFEVARAVSTVRHDGNSWRVPIPDLQQPKTFPFNRAA